MSPCIPLASRNPVTRNFHLFPSKANPENTRACPRLVSFIVADILAIVTIPRSSGTTSRPCLIDKYQVQSAAPPPPERTATFNLKGIKWGIRIPDSYNPLFIMPEKDENLNILGAGEATNFWDPQNPPLFVSSSNSAPSKKIVPYLSLLFPNVPERAKQNNVLLESGEVDSIEEYLDSQAYCSDYDVTIVIDQGADKEDKVRTNLENIGRKARVNCAFSCCILTMVNDPHEHAARLLWLFLVMLGRWLDIMDRWGSAKTTLMSGPVSDFYTYFTHFKPSPKVKDNRQSKEGDASFIEIYSKPLCRALGMSPVPSLAFESANSDDIQKLFHDCITWLAGSYLRVDTVVGVNNSPDTYSVDILNFDSTVDNLLRLADELGAQQYPVTREALLLSAKMKTSVIILQLRLLQYLLDLPQGRTCPTQEEIDDMNRHLAGDIDRAQRLCPDLGIKRLDLERFHKLDVLTLRGFADDIPNEISHYHKILNRRDIRVLHSKISPRDAIVCATYAIVYHTDPLTFGPISKQFTVPPDLTIQLPKRALCTLMGDGNITVNENELGVYFRGFPQKVPMMDVDLQHEHIRLEWIEDPPVLAIDRGISPNQLTQENYNPSTTLGGHIKFRYIRIEGLRAIAQEINVPSEGDANLVAWNILRKKKQQVLIDDQNNRPPKRSHRSTPAALSTWVELDRPQNWIPNFARPTT
uniref:ARAD1D49302p n=1 Tax=Blastobotrys adeninivorans TaxID=409370 RepID=A0A060TE60_BLAAD